MSFDEEVLIDEEVRQALDGLLLGWDGVTSGRLLGGVSYHANDSAFALLMEGVVGIRLDEPLRRHSLTLAGVSPLTPPDDADGFEDWVQLVFLLPEDVGDIAPWLEAAYKRTSAEG